MNKLMTVKEVAEYMNTSTKTVLRLIRKGKLPAAKVGGQWRVKPEDLEIFLKKRLLYLGQYASPPMYFRPEVLEQYRKDISYFVHEAGFDGRIGRKKDYYKDHIRRSTLGWSKDAFGKDNFNPPTTFPEIAFWKVTLNDNSTAIVLDPRAFYNMPEAEQRKWSNYQIFNPQV
ncbi:MAG: helix-turn-helix domain-containing protein [Candidatus Brocadiia bacterium]